MGWSDPYPDEHSSIEQELIQALSDGHLVYDQKIYQYDYCPLIIFIPSKLVLVKMMRACIGVDKKENLWIYSKP